MTLKSVKNVGFIVGKAFLNAGNRKKWTFLDFLK